MFDEITNKRLFDATTAFDHPVVLGITACCAAALIAAFATVFALKRMDKLSPETFLELKRRCISWCVLIPLMLVPVLLGGAWVIVGVALLSLACYREFSRATGAFRDRFMSLVVVTGIALLTFAIADHWYGLFAAAFPLTVLGLAGLAVMQDKPTGYIQRVALAVFGFALFGVGLGHLGYIANDSNYRAILVMILFLTQVNDISAYCCGKIFGKRKLCPNTSPNKTIGGSVGAASVIVVLTCLIGREVFRDSAMQSYLHLVGLGLVITLTTQLGDLVMSSVKRDIGVKDMGATIPGHGGLLDRFDGLLFAAPAVFHYIGYFSGVGLDQPMRIISTMVVGGDG